MPFVTGLTSLMTVRDGVVCWEPEDIEKTVLSQLENMIPLYDGQLEAFDWDPQRLAKSPSSHKTAAALYKAL